MPWHTDGVTVSPRHRRPDIESQAVPSDYVARLINGWHSERPDLEVDPVAIVNRVGRLAAYFAAEIERVFAGSSITSADFAVLANLRRSGRPFQLTQRQLMDALRLTSGTVSVRIDRLAERGLVRRDPAPDARGVLVTLTDTGARAFDALAPEHLANEARLVAALDPRQQATLATLLQLLLVEYEPGVDNRPDERLGLVVAPAHTGLRRQAAVGLAPQPGLLVESVRPGGPAAAAGIRAGDLLVRTPARELRSLTCLAQAIDGARSVSVDIHRGEVDVTVTVKVPPRAAPARHPERS
jgi:DNA-binding MarR family transcriptional regulator